ncbi:hypothetical protein M9Y10_017582 [Tritrichomonas musculus]|uniref:C2H2-type domain-containing protein n=1 Tax=Tritrichomonas musculus TaxID=1915356 RepID=A0ABR2HVI6_9EUKA
MKQSYESHFTESYLNIQDYIQKWPDTIDENDIVKFVNYENANMIFVPVINSNGKEIISKKDFYCSLCKKWLKISESVKQIKLHASIHVPELFKKATGDENPLHLNEQQAKNFRKNITAFILFEINSFKSADSIFLKNITDNTPSRDIVTRALSNLAKAVRREIKQYLISSSANYITFEEWSDFRKREFLGITIRSYKKGKYQDYFLDLIYLYSEINDSDVLSGEIVKCLNGYGLRMSDIISCTTDNCRLMIGTAEKLLTWRIPCFLNSSNKYQSFIDRQAEMGIHIKKVPSFSEVRWTSFCDCLLTIYETKDSLKQFLGSKYLDKKQELYLTMLQNLCKSYKRAVLKYENDSFGAISFFLIDIKVINNLFTELETTDFREAVLMAKEKIKEYKSIHWYFWDIITPIAVLLNPQIEEYSLLLTTEQIDDAKKEIERRMKNYPLIITKDDDDDVEDDDYRLSLFKRATDNEINKAPIIKILEKRSSKIKNLQEFWEKKIGTEENQLALVALEILGV